MGARDTDRDDDRRIPVSGFTLIELMVVIAILAIALRIVLPSFLGDIPEAQVQAEARKLAAKLSYLRSEARLQARRYGIEIAAPDEGLHGYRILMPRDQEIRHDGGGSSERLPKELGLGWNMLPETVKFLGVHVGLADQEGTKARRIFFDPRGRTSQKVLYLAHRVNKDVVYSIIVPPLTGQIETRKGRVRFATAVDSDF